MALLSEYIPDLREILREKDVNTNEQFFGDGVLDLWAFRDKPVAEDSVIVTFDGSLVTTTVYTVDYNQAYILFAPAPSDGVVVEVSYDYYRHTDDTLIAYMKKAVIGLEMLYPIGYVVSGTGITSGVDPDPTDDVKEIWFQLAQLQVKRDDLLDRMESSYDWRDGSVAVNEVSTVRAIAGILDQKWQDIMWNIDLLKVNNTGGYRRAGGAEACEYGAYGYAGDYTNEGGGPWPEYLWFLGLDLEL
jgi:hypothetical protein